MKHSISAALMILTTVSFINADTVPKPEDIDAWTVLVKDSADSEIYLGKGPSYEEALFNAFKQCPTGHGPWCKELSSSKKDDPEANILVTRIHELETRITKLESALNEAKEPQFTCTAGSYYKSFDGEGSTQISACNEALKMCKHMEYDTCDVLKKRMEIQGYSA